VLTPFVERLAMEEERKAGLPDPEVLKRSPPELQRRYGKEGGGRTSAEPSTRV
jgi:hypothetical protein